MAAARVRQKAVREKKNNHYLFCLFFFNCFCFGARSLFFCCHLFGCFSFSVVVFFAGYIVVVRLVGVFFFPNCVSMSRSVD